MLSVIGRVQKSYIDMGNTPMDRLFWVIRQIPLVQCFMEERNLKTINQTNIAMTSLLGVPVFSWLLLRWLYRTGRALPFSVDSFTGLVSNLL